MIQVVSGKENNEKGPTFKVGDHVGISKCKNIFAKLYVPNWLEEVFAITKVKIVCHEHTLLMILTICQNVLQKRSTKSKSKRAQNRKK